MNVLVQEVVPVGSSRCSPSLGALPRGTPLLGESSVQTKPWELTGVPEPVGIWGQGPWIAQATCEGSRTFIYDRSWARLRGPRSLGLTPCPALSTLEGQTGRSCSHPQRRPRPNAGEASVVKRSAYFCPKIDFI